MADLAQQPAFAIDKSSRFYLPRDVSELASANAQQGPVGYLRKPTRNPSLGDDFPGKEHEFIWSNGATAYTDGMRSRPRMRLQILRGDDTQPPSAFGLAPSMNLMAAMFSAIELRSGAPYFRLCFFSSAKASN